MLTINIPESAIRTFSILQSTLNNLKQHRTSYGKLFTDALKKKIEDQRKNRKSYILPEPRGLIRLPELPAQAVSLLREGVHFASAHGCCHVVGEVLGNTEAVVF